MWTKLFLITSLATCISGNIYSQKDWTLKKDANGIKVFVRKSSTSSFDNVRVTCVCNGRISQLAAVLMDINNHTAWVYNTDTAYLLKKVSAADLYYYTIVESPWPAENRDLAVHMTLRQNPDDHVLTIEADDTPNYVPIYKDLVRVPFSKATWTITPLPGNRFSIDYQVSVNPGGSVPAWLINLFIAHAPYESFKKLTARLNLPKYQNQTFSFIKE